MLFWISMAFWTLFVLYVSTRFIQSVRMVPTQKAYIVERLGRYHRTLGPGLHALIPFFDRVAYIQELKEESLEVPPQECFTCDNVRVEVDGVIFISVTHPENASYGITDYRYAGVQLAQTTIRSVIGTMDLDRTFEDRDDINSHVVRVLSEVSEAWGIRVHRYEVKNIVPPASVRDAMERQMAAERERRAMLARAEGEKQAHINESEGQKIELINTSEGEMQKRINEAQGRAAEILSIAHATAESLEKLGAAAALPGGADAVRLQLSQKYIQRLSLLARPGTHIVVPGDLTQLSSLLAGVGLDRSFEITTAIVSQPANLQKPNRNGSPHLLSSEPENELTPRNPLHTLTPEKAL